MWLATSGNGPASELFQSNYDGLFLRIAVCRQLFQNRGAVAQFCTPYPQPPGTDVTATRAEAASEPLLLLDCCVSHRWISLYNRRRRWPSEADTLPIVNGYSFQAAKGGRFVN